MARDEGSSSWEPPLGRFRDLEPHKTKLTDAQLIVLTSACKRDDGLAVLPAGMKPAAAAKLAASLVKKELVREIRAKFAAATFHSHLHAERTSGRSSESQPTWASA